MFLASTVNIQEFNKGVSFRLEGIGYGGLCRRIAKLPGVSFTNLKRFFWSEEDVKAEFTFKGETYLIDKDCWDGALWVMTKNGKPLDGMQELKNHLERRAKSQESPSAEKLPKS